MLILKRITSPEDALLSCLEELYKEAFPPEERREIDQLRFLIAAQPEMFFNAVECDGELAGLFVYWKFHDFYYLEHLAVFASMRNKKIGQQTLDWVEDHLKGIRLLEVEPAVENIAVRRVNYYQRNGYKILDKEYRQPSYDGAPESWPLWIMGNQEYDDRSLLNKHIEQIKEQAYYKPVLFRQHTGK